MKNAQKEKPLISMLIPVMLAFLAMGFVDLVSIAANYIKKDFELSDSVANIFTSMVFFWFLIFSVPTGMLMNKIGRRKTVIISLLISLAGLSLPLIDYNLPLMLAAFCLIGIGNAVMQVSLNPLLSNIVSKEKLSSAVTFGQFLKAVTAFAAPIIAAWGARKFGNWRILFLIFLIEGIIATIALSRDKIKEDKITCKASTFKECFILLKDKVVLMCFLGFACHVGVDVGISVSAPRILMEKLKIDLDVAGYAASIYFLFRTFGSLAGTYILAKFSNKTFFGISTVFLAMGMIGLLLFDAKTALYICIAVIGFNNSNIFSVLFSHAILHHPDKKNEISGLMIMAIFGGTVFPVIMGIVSDIAGSQSGAVAVMIIIVAYIISITPKLNKAE